MSRPGKWMLAVLVTAGMFMAFLDTTIVDITLPKMMSSLEADIYDAQWIIISYFMGAAIAMTVVGWMAQSFGHRDTYLGGLVLFVGMSALCGAASSLEAMLVFRFFQGIAEGMMIPVGWLLISEGFQQEERGLAMGVYGLGAAFAPAVGPSLGGLLTEYLNWRWVFYVNVPIGLLDGILLLLLFPNRKSPQIGPLDKVGVVLLSVALSALVVFVSKGQEKGWLQSDFILQMAAIFSLSFIGFLLWELFYPHPLIPRDIFRNREVSLGLLALAMNSIAAYGVYLLLPVFLQKVRGYTTQDSGLIMLPGSLASAISTLLGGALADRGKPKAVAALFLLAGAWATWTFSTGYFDPRFSLVLDNLLWGFAISGSFAPLSYLIFASLKEDRYPHGTMLINVTRLVSGSIGTAISTNLLTTRQDAFYDALAWRMDWGHLSRGGLLGILEAWVSPAARSESLDPDSVHFMLQIARSFLQAIAGSEAFMATYKHLALYLLTGVLVVLGCRNLRGRASTLTH